jgi:hypothetical protein
MRDCIIRYFPHLVAEAVALDDLHAGRAPPRVGVAGRVHLGSGRIVTSETEAPNMLGSLV